MSQPTRLPAQSVRKPLNGLLGSFAASAAALALAALSGCAEEASEEPAYTPKPRPPYSSDEYSSTRLILRHENDGFEALSSTPSLGGVTEADIDRAMPDLLEGRKDLYSYVARNADGELLAQGFFTVPTTARATFTEADDSGRVHHVELDDPSPIVRIAIPFLPELATIEFQSMVPDRDRRYQNWTRENAGTVRVTPGTVEQRGKEGPS